MDVSEKTGIDGMEMTAANTEMNTEPTAMNAGVDLLDEVAALTGLPPEWVQTELNKIVAGSGHDPQSLTLDDLRASMLTYLEKMASDLETQESDDMEFLKSLSIASDMSH